MQWTGVLYSFWCHYSVVFCHWYQISIPQCCGASERFFATHILTHQIDHSAFLIRQVALHAHTMKVFTALSAANDPNKVQVSTLCVFTTNQYWQCAIWFHSCWCALRFAANLRHISEKRTMRLCAVQRLCEFAVQWIIKQTEEYGEIWVCTFPYAVYVFVISLIVGGVLYALQRIWHVSEQDRLSSVPHRWRRSGW